MLTQLLTAIILTPILGFIGCLLTPKKSERMIVLITIVALYLELALLLAFGYQWVSSGAKPVFAELGTLYSSPHYTFSFEFYFDRLSAVFFGMSVVMVTLISIFSKYYLHREDGFKRFYGTLFLFFTGLTLAVLAGNFEVLFIGWELIGITSVLLIAFYRDRFLPARNALKVFSVYRIGDAFLLAAILYAHHIFESNINFSEFSTLIEHHGNQLAVLGFLLLAVALVKSAQFPFSYWLPRAMEGPTTSSAIFYGALSVHMGLYLLLRMHPLWEGSVEVRIAVALFGLITAVVATTIARVQSSIKTQIAYASIAQIGLMFIEVAAGLYWLAMLHFISNAALRAYQLLISPSVVSYLVHDQFFYFVPPAHKIKNTFFGKLYGTLYVLGIKEWSMNSAMRKFLWGPLKSVGRSFAFLDSGRAQLIATAFFIAVAGISFFAQLPPRVVMTASIVTALISGILYVRAYTSKKSPASIWNLIGLGHLFGVLFLTVASRSDWIYLILYSSGVTAAFLAGHACLWYLRKKGEPDSISEYRGAIYAYRGVGNLFFVLALLFMAFPISPSFLVQDILLSMIPGDHAFLIVFFCFSYLIMGISVMRLFMKVFFGPYKLVHHETAYRSS